MLQVESMGETSTLQLGFLDLRREAGDYVPPKQRDCQIPYSNFYIHMHHVWKGGNLQISYQQCIQPSDQKGHQTITAGLGFCHFLMPSN